MQYKRCEECSFVYDSELEKCPNCGALNTISESIIDSVVFNIND
jgi:RNA polymerase subunit RPABC4/transcription elongation factor Spt4